jgi:hypothetical protein
MGRGFWIENIITALGQTRRSAPTKILGYLIHIPKAAISQLFSRRQLATLTPH